MRYKHIDSKDVKEIEEILEDSFKKRETISADAELIKESSEEESLYDEDSYEE